MKKLACFILCYEITKGMKSFGPKGLLKSKKSKELINCQIANIIDKNIDIFVIVGFGNDRIKKKIDYKNINVINNDLYDIANQGYAMELILSNYDSSKYDGCIIINNGILFNNIVKEIIVDNINLSKIFYVKKKNTDKKTNFHIGCSVNDSYIEHMFFNLTDNVWNEIVYLDTKTVDIYKNLYNKTMRNMFLFELINKTIELGVKYEPIRLKSNYVVKIINSKDSEKIKEKI
jgi:hypothetical protein